MPLMVIDAGILGFSCNNWGGNGDEGDSVVGILPIYRDIFECTGSILVSERIYCQYTGSILIPEKYIRVYGQYIDSIRVAFADLPTP